MQKTTNNKSNETVIEVRSTMNDNVVTTVVVPQEESVNIFSLGYTKICNMLGINRVIAEERFYVTKA